MLLAIGIDPEAFRRWSCNRPSPQHAELAWMLTCVTPVGWLERMTQYKAKVASAGNHRRRPAAISRC